jgi:hypothetical protein
LEINKVSLAMARIMIVEKVTIERNAVANINHLLTQYQIKLLDKEGIK